MLFTSCLSWSQSQFSKSFDIVSSSGFESPSKFIKCSDNGYAFVVTGSANGMQVIKTDSLADVEWSTEIEGHYYFGAITEKNLGGYWIATSTLDSNYNYFQTMLSIDNSGNLEWAKAYEEPETFSSAIEVIELNNSLLLIGNRYDSIAQTRKFTTTKTDFLGNVLWQKQYDDTSDIEVRDAIKISDNEIIIAGIGWYYNTANLLKIDSTGNIIWNKTYQDTAYYDIEALAIDTCSNGDIVLTGRRTYATWDIMAMRLSSNGDFIWGKHFRNDISDDEGYSIHENTNGSLIICAEPESYNGNASQTALILTNNNGNLQWFKILQPNQQSFPFGSVQNSDGSITILGIQGSWGIDSAEVSIIKTSPSFETTCNQQTVTTNEESFTVLTINTNQSSLFSHMTSIPLSSQSLSIKSTTICSGVGITENKEDFGFTIYPNPTDGVVYLNRIFQTISVFDQFGRKQLTVRNSDSIDLSNLKQGLYFIKVENENEIFSRRIIVN